MTRKEYIYNIRKVLTVNRFTDDSKLSINYVGAQLDKYRAKEIRDTYGRTPIIEPIWVQDMGKMECSLVSRSQDSSVNIKKDCKLSKLVLPPVVSLNDTTGNISNISAIIMSVCESQRYYYQTFDTFSLNSKSDNELNCMYKFYTRKGNEYYFDDGTKFVRPHLILESPLDGYVIDNSYIQTGNIVLGTIYKVEAGNITYNGTVYNVGQTFTGTSTAVFTGPGKVVLNDPKRKMTNDDEYPMSATMAEVVLMKVFTLEYGLTKEQIKDKRNDSSDELGGEVSRPR